MSNQREIELNSELMRIQEEKDHTLNEIVQISKEKKRLLETIESLQMENNSLKSMTFESPNLSGESELEPTSTSSDEQRRRNNCIESECVLLRKNVLELEYQLSQNQNR